jgi:hypothetical protein
VALIAGILAFGKRIGPEFRYELQADRLEGRSPATRKDSYLSIERLEQIALEYCAEDAPEHTAAPLQTLLPLSGRVDDLLRSLEKEIA